MNFGVIVFLVATREPPIGGYEGTLDCASSRRRSCTKPTVTCANAASNTPYGPTRTWRDVALTNWPKLNEPFIAQVASHLRHRVVVTGGKLQRSSCLGQPDQLTGRNGS